MNKSIYKIVLIVMGFLHLLIFAVVPMATMSADSLLGGLSQIAGAIGLGGVADAVMPEKLTLLSMMKLGSLAGSLGMDESMVIVFYACLLTTTVQGLLIAILNLAFNGRKSCVAALIFTILQVINYGSYFYVMVEYMGMLGYEVCVPAFVFIGILLLAQFVMSIVAIVKCAPGAASVKPGKKDGTITGVRGAYQGAVIPVKNGETVVIGRDPSVCSIVVKDERASRKHCSVSYSSENDIYTVTDYSSNGTYSSDSGRLPSGTTTPVRPGCEISIGEKGEMFRLG